MLILMLDLMWELMCELVGASALCVQFGSMVLWTCGDNVQMDTGFFSSIDS